MLPTIQADLPKVFPIENRITQIINRQKKLNEIKNNPCKLMHLHQLKLDLVVEDKKNVDNIIGILLSVYIAVGCDIFINFVETNKARIPDELLLEMGMSKNELKECCHNCGNSDVKLKCCGRCGKAKYCSKICQREDYSFHELVCE
jgi:hypothetical protein